MKFEKGNTYGKGRPKGTPNKTTAQIREFLQSVSESLEDRIFEDLEELSAADRVKFWLSIQEYLIPKLSRTEVNSDDKETIVTVRVIDRLDATPAPNN